MDLNLMDTGSMDSQYQLEFLKQIRMKYLKVIGKLRNQQISLYLGNQIQIIKALKFGLMEAIITEFFLIVLNRVSVFISGQMGRGTLVTGFKMNCQDWELLNGQMDEFLKEHLKTELCTEKVSILGQMAVNMKVNTE